MLYPFSIIVASTISKNLSVNRFPVSCGVFIKIKLTIAEIVQTNINQKPELYAIFFWFDWHVLDEKAPIFARKQ